MKKVYHSFLNEENGHVDTAGEGGVGRIGRLGLTYIHYHV